MPREIQRPSRRQFLTSTALAGAALGSLATLSCRGSAIDTLDCEVAIVGSGFAGTHLALRLAAQGIDTVIVEAGADFRSPRFKTGFRGKNTGGVWYPIDAARHIGVGGTSQMWTGVVCRLLPEDFQLRSLYGFGADWPMDYQDLLPYYCQAEQVLETEGNPPIAQAEPPRDCAYPHESPAAPYAHGTPIDGIDAQFLTMALSKRDGKPVRLNRSETETFEAHTHGRLLIRRQVTAIATKDGHVDHLETHSTFEPPLRVRAKHYVLAAGPFECARLLLRSANETSPDGLGNDHGQVGRHFNAHPAIMRNIISAKTASLTPGAHRTYSLQDSWRRAGLNACAFQVLAEPDGTTEWRAVPEIEPSANNRVSLAEGTEDLFGNPHVTLDFNYTDRDHATIKKGREILDQIEHGYADDPLTSEEWENWRSHPAGTTRMAARAEDGVVDATNKVFGIDNLYVSGASVFPNSGTPNPTLTVTALTLRLADHIARTHYQKNV